jgi:hypothetical protein
MKKRKFIHKIFIIIAFVLVILGSSYTGVGAESPKDKVRCGPIMKRSECLSYGQKITEVIDFWGTCTWKSTSTSESGDKKQNLYKTDCLSSGGLFNETPQPTDDIIYSEKTPEEGSGILKRDTIYNLLTSIPCDATSSASVECDPQTGLISINTGDSNTALGVYLNITIRIFIGICGVLAVIIIVIGGLEYMTSGLISTMEHGKQRMTGAVLGLLLALGSWTILNQINPNLLSVDFSSLTNQRVNVTQEPETGIQGKGTGKKTITTVGGKSMTACDETQMVIISLFGSSVQVHKGVANSLKRINAKWLSTPEQQRYKVNSVGGYNCREVTGKPGFWSAHAFGVALDINPSTNPYGKNAKSDMPVNFVQLFKAEGWGWGGEWSSVKDGMHFSKFPPNEGGNGVVEGL